jgi:hypothetical protein
MQYEEEYNQVTNVQEFTKLVVKNHPFKKKTNIKRQYYRLRAKLGKINRKIKNQKPIVDKKDFKLIEVKSRETILEPKVIFDKNEYLGYAVSRPDRFKLNVLADFYEMQKKPEKSELIKYGFTAAEVRWLQLNDLI